MAERSLNLARCGTLGEYGEIREIFADSLVFIHGWLACTRHILNGTEILIPESVEMMMEEKHG